MKYRLKRFGIEKKICKGDCPVCKGHGGQCTFTVSFYTFFILHNCFRLRTLYLKIIGRYYIVENGKYVEKNRWSKRAKCSQCGIKAGHIHSGVFRN
jgi:hypothetical protein